MVNFLPSKFGSHLSDTSPQWSHKYLLRGNQQVSEDFTQTCQPCLTTKKFSPSPGTILSPLLKTVNIIESQGQSLNIIRFWFQTASPKVVFTIPRSFYNRIHKVGMIQSGENMDFWVQITVPAPSGCAILDKLFNLSKSQFLYLYMRGLIGFLQGLTETSVLCTYLACNRPSKILVLTIFLLLKILF